MKNGVSIKKIISYVTNITSKRRTVYIIVLVLVLLLAGILIANMAGRPESGNEGVPGETISAETQGKASVKQLVDTAKALKGDLKSVLKDIKNDRYEEAKTKLEDISQNLKVIRGTADKVISTLKFVPGLRGQAENLGNMLDMAEMGIDKIAKPALDQLQAYPLSKLRAGDGINTELLIHYLDFAETIMPDVETLMELANATDFSLIDKEGKLDKYLNLANELMDIYGKDKTILAKAKTMLGAEGDRLYILAAQNSAEIRASGGFPGSVGTVQIKDGVLTLGEFKAVYEVLSNHPQGAVKITQEEYRLFNYFSTMQTPRDADLCPDFERVAYVWSLGYETAQRQPVDGVISMTPVIVQKLLEAMDEEIELFDGLVLTKDNATKILQHDLYFKYFNKSNVVGRRETSDQLFADAAKKTMDKLMSNMSVSDLAGYLMIAKEGFADRTLLLWMKDTAEQETIRNLGWNGGLNTDPENPQAGVYFNCIIASKMGWFLIMDTEMGERVRNEDGTYTYPITVTLSNDITQEEIKTASNTEILGGYNGAIRGAVYFFAPAGGTIQNFAVNIDTYFRPDTYNGLSLYVLPGVLIKPDEPVTVTYEVTVAPGVETPLVFSKTPTVQDYH